MSIYLLDTTLAAYGSTGHTFCQIRPAGASVGPSHHSDKTRSMWPPEVVLDRWIKERRRLSPGAPQRVESAEFAISQNPDFAFLWAPGQPFARCRTAEMRIVDEMPVIQAEPLCDG